MFDQFLSNYTTEKHLKESILPLSERLILRSPEVLLRGNALQIDLASFDFSLQGFETKGCLELFRQVNRVCFE